MNTITMKPEADLKRLWNFCLRFFLFLFVSLAVVLSFVEVPMILIGVIVIPLVIVLFLVALYLPAFYKTLLYTMTNEAVVLRKGVFWKKQTTVPYHKITHIDLTQNPLDRLYGLWSLHIQTAGAGGQQGTTAEIVIVGVKDGEGFKDLIMNRVKQLYKVDEVIPRSTESSTSEGEILQSILDEVIAIRQNISK